MGRKRKYDEDVEIMPAEPDVIECLGDKLVNLAWLKDFFKCKDVEGASYRMRMLGIRGRRFGNGFNYYSLSRILRELQQ